MTLYNIVGASTLVAGQPEDVSQVLANLQAIQAILNGAIDDSNINSAAAISRSKIAGYPWHDADIAAAAAIAVTKLSNPADITKFLRGDGTWNPVALALNNISGITPHALAVGGATYMASLAVGNAKDILLSGGAAADPAWTAPGSVAASYSGTPADPTPIGNSTLGMVGLGGAAKITPVGTRVFFSIQGTVISSGTAATFGMRYGTGAAPANAAAATGTAIGADRSGIWATAAGDIPFTASGIVSGLAPGTAYWFDLAALVTGSAGIHVTFKALTLSAFDLL